MNLTNYLKLNGTLSFAACEIRHCINMNIVNDLVDEEVELFEFTLERTPDLDLRILLHPAERHISTFGSDCKKCSNNG